jgi:hypothetical protein
LRRVDYDAEQYLAFTELRERVTHYLSEANGWHGEIQCEEAMWKFKSSIRVIFQRVFVFRTLRA